MFNSHIILINGLKQKIVWCVVVLTGVWLHLLHSRSHNAWAATGFLLLTAIFAAIDRFVLSQITPERITIIPELTHDLTPDFALKTGCLSVINKQQKGPKCEPAGAFIAAAATIRA